MATLKKYIRTALTYFPWINDLKYEAQSRVGRVLARPSEPTYEMFRWFPFEQGREFLDMGSNRGQTIDSMRMFRKDVAIVAFEPNPVLFDRLQRRYRSDGLLTIHNIGLGEIEDRLTLYIPSYQGYVFDGLASFDRREAADWLNADTIAGFRPEKLHVAEVTSPIRTWDSVSTRPSLVKIDVQGLELSVLRGGQRTIEEYRPVFIIENDRDMLPAQFLKGLGYRLVGYEGGKLTPDEVSYRNTLYIPDEKLPVIMSAAASA